MRYFLSQTPDIAVECSTGKRLKFHSTDGRVGFIALDPDKDEGEIKCVENCIKRSIGGVISEVERADFEAWEKKTKGKPGFQRRLDEFRGTGAATDTSSAPRPQPQPSSPPDAPAAEADAGPTDTPPPAPAQPATTDAPPLRRRGSPAK